MRLWPRRRWGDPRKLLVGLGTGAVLSTLVTIQLMPDPVSLRVNEIAQEDVMSPRYVRYLDEEATEELRARARARVPKQYTTDLSAPTEAEREARRFFEAVRRVQAGRTADTQERPARGLAEELGSVFTRETLVQALQQKGPALDRLEQITVDLIARVMGLVVLRPEAARPRGRICRVEAQSYI
jgi:membrane-associated HD superfamily phosphohydrolase